LQPAHGIFKGLAAAQYGVGVMHEHDQGVPQDYAEAAR
jgi:TPR repeat protein